MLSCDTNTCTCKFPCRPTSLILIQSTFPNLQNLTLTVSRAVYTAIKKRVFLTFRFSLEVARQLPGPKHCKKPESKNPPPKCGFLKLCQFFSFFANVNACSPLTGIIRVFGHVGRDLLRNHPRPVTYCALHTVKGRQKSRMRTTY